MHSISSASAVQQRMRFLLAFCVCKKKTFLGLPGSQCWFILQVALAGYVKAKIAEAAACLLSFWGLTKESTPICNFPNSYRDIRALKYGTKRGSGRPKWGPEGHRQQNTLYLCSPSLDWMQFTHMQAQLLCLSAYSWVWNWRNTLIAISAVIRGPVGILCSVFNKQIQMLLKY